MKRHRTAAKLRLVAHNQRGAPKSVSDRTHAVEETYARQRPALAPRLALAGASARVHTLILSGNLDRHSAPILEAEIEHLLDEGVGSVVLDLRQLTTVDATGVAVLAFRSQLCRRRGYELRLIPGSPLMQRTFEKAGVTDLVAPPDDHIAAARLAAAPSEPAALDVAAGESSGGR
jgi:anti-sigma B factor antagonist